MNSHTFQAQLSPSYVILVEEMRAAGSWVVGIRGPCPLTEHHQPSMDLKNAKREAYSLARRHFLEKAIAEIPIEFEDLSWISY
jgi:hypothetical protein